MTTDFTEAQVRDHQLVRALVATTFDESPERAARGAAALLSGVEPYQALAALIMAVRVLGECARELAEERGMEPAVFWEALCAKWAGRDMEIIDQLGEGDPNGN